MPKTFNPASDIPDLGGKTIIVTGGNAGLGAATVAAIAAHKPAHIFLTARRRAAAEESVKTIKSLSSSTTITIVDLDLASFESVKAAGEKIAAEAQRIDLLVLNAGIAGVKPTVTPDGYEIHFGTNHMGHALLTQYLLPTLLSTSTQAGTDTRIVVISSEAHRQWGYKSGIEFDRVKTDMAGDFAMKTYGHSKLANLLFARSLAAKYPAIKTIAIHPGRVNTAIFTKATSVGSIVQKILGGITGLAFLTPDEGAKNQLWAAFGSDATSGEYYEPIGKLNKDSKLSKDKALAEKLWDWTNGELQAHGGPGWPASK